MNQQGILLVLPVPFRRKDGVLCIESQACNGLERWADNFGSVIMAAPTFPEGMDTGSMTWQPASVLEQSGRFTFVPLPWGYPRRAFRASYPRVRQCLADLIGQARYLHFAIGGASGDWACVAAREAKKQGRPYAVHTDRVESEVVLKVTRNAPLPVRLLARLTASRMARTVREIISSGTVGLWNGQECYDAYSPFCRNSYLVHDVHTKPADNIAPQDVDRKVREVAGQPGLRLVYAGRADPMKAPLDWVRAVAWASDKGVPLEATWMGEGPLLESMQEMVAEKQLGSVIRLTGFEQDRNAVLKKIREADAMLFTHVTAESPRCLIEALVCGTPIIGYQSAYPEHLTRHLGGGLFVPAGDWKRLGQLIVSLWQDRSSLARKIEEAARNGRRFNDCAIFAERSNLMKKHLP